MPPPRFPDVGRNLVNQRGAASGSNSGKFAPQTIQCHHCKRNKPRDQYANRQLQKLAHNPYALGNRIKEPEVTCKTCTPAQTTELFCRPCHEWKGLDAFAKNQRKTPDSARCMMCVQKHLDTEPDIEPPDSDEYADPSSQSENDDFDEAPAAKTSKANGSRNGGSVHQQSTKPRGQSVHNTFVSNAFTEKPKPGDYENYIDADRDSGSGSSDEWETVAAAGPATRKSARSMKHGTGAGSVVSNDTGNSGAYQYGMPHARGEPGAGKKSGWASVPKVQKGKERMWGEEPEEEPIEDEWSAYGRQIREKKEGKKPAKKKNIVISDDDEEEWD